MPYEVMLKFGLSVQTKFYATVNEARRSADSLAATYATKFGRAEAILLNEAGEQLYVRVSNFPPPSRNNGNNQQ